MRAQGLGGVGTERGYSLRGQYIRKGVPKCSRPSRGTDLKTPDEAVISIAAG